jgi:hypothetical protein
VSSLTDRHCRAMLFSADVVGVIRRFSFPAREDGFD